MMIMLVLMNQVPSLGQQQLSGLQQQLQHINRHRQHNCRALGFGIAEGRASPDFDPVCCFCCSFWTDAGGAAEPPRAGFVRGIFSDFFWAVAGFEAVGFFLAFMITFFGGILVRN